MANQYPELPIVGYLRATKSGEPIWSEDCVCQDPVYPSDPEGSDSDCISMPVVRLSDAVRAMRANTPKEAKTELQVWRSTDSCGEFWSWDECDQYDYDRAKPEDRRIICIVSENV